MKASETKFRNFLELAPYGIVIVNQSGEIEIVNAQIERMFGYDREELIGKPVEVLIPERFGKIHVAHRTDYVAHPTLRPMGEDLELTARRKDGSEIPVNISLSPVESEGRLLINAIIIDISHHKRMTQMLALQTEELKRSNAELEQFAYVASHDLREPLRKIQTFADILNQVIPADVLGEDERKFLSGLQDAAQRMQVLINDLLKFSRLTRWEQIFEVVSLQKIAKDVVSDLDVHIQETGARLEIETLPDIEADPTQMRQLIQNLISNAIKFHKPGQPPLVKIHSENLASDVDLPPGRPEGVPYCRIYVEENGIGFEEKYLDRIFIIFHRLNPRLQYEGTGIGLALCRKIVERHNGHSTAQSTPGSGATFVITLPIRQPQKDQT